MPPGSLGTRGVVRRLALIVGIQQAGGGAIVITLPLAIVDRGHGSGTAGLVMAAFFLAGLVFQYPAGWLVDRVGSTAVLVGGQVAFALASIAFLASANPAVEGALRALQGLGAGATEVAAMAAVTRLVPPSGRGRATSEIYRMATVGLAVGPLIGASLGVGRLNEVFEAAAAGSLVAAALTWSLRRHMAPLRTAGGGVVTEVRPPHAVARHRRAVLGSLAGAGVLGLTIGVYEVCWTLLLVHRHAAGWQIGLSWTTFSIPFILISPLAGHLTDHSDRRLLVLGGLALTTLECAAYPFIPSVGWLIALGAVEGVGFASVLPGLQSLLTSGQADDEAGRVQGVFTATQTGATAAMAMSAGALFAQRTWLPFVTASALSAGLLVVAGDRFRRVPGRVAPPAEVVAEPVP